MNHQRFVILVLASAVMFLTTAAMAIDAAWLSGRIALEPKDLVALNIAVAVAVAAVAKIRPQT